jgi:hypothetical protein
VKGKPMMMRMVYAVVGKGEISVQPDLRLRRFLASCCKVLIVSSLENILNFDLIDESDNLKSGLELRRCESHELGLVADLAGRTRLRLLLYDKAPQR